MVAIIDDSPHVWNSEQLVGGRVVAKKCQNLLQTVPYKFFWELGFEVNALGSASAKQPLRSKIMVRFPQPSVGLARSFDQHPPRVHAALTNALVRFSLQNVQRVRLKPTFGTC
jgi:hypothetical protein